MAAWVNKSVCPYWLLPETLSSGHSTKGSANANAERQRYYYQYCERDSHALDLWLVITDARGTPVPFHPPTSSDLEGFHLPKDVSYSSTQSSDFPRCPRRGPPQTQQECVYVWVCVWAYSACASEMCVYVYEGDFSSNWEQLRLPSSAQSSEIGLSEGERTSDFFGVFFFF